MTAASGHTLHRHCEQPTALGGDSRKKGDGMTGGAHAPCKTSRENGLRGLRRDSRNELS